MLWAALAVFFAAFGLLAKAAGVKRRHLRFARAAAPVDAGAVRLFESTRALYHGTQFGDGTTLLISAWRDACVCDLYLTAEGLFVQREAEGMLLHVPLAAVEEAALHRAHAPLAGKELPMLRLRWTRGGEKLETELSLRGGMASLETLRREIHLRQGNVARQLAAFLEKQP